MKYRTLAAALGAAAFGAAAAAAADTLLPPVDVTSTRAAEPRDAESATRPEVDAAVRAGARRIEDLAAQVPGMQVDVTDGGFTSAVGLRGFTVSRFYLDGLPDVTRMFVRDLATVDAVRIVRGPAAVAAGLNSPGGTVWFDLKRPQWQPAQQWSAGGGSGEAWRAGVDSTGPLGGAASRYAHRLVVQVQDGRSRPGDLAERHDTTLAALAWRDADLGLVTAEVERQHDRQPFGFGTVILDGAVRYGQLYASRHQRSMRRMDRQALRWQREGGDGEGGAWRLEADLVHARVLRDETLIGFWTIDTPTTLSGYYTRYHDDYTQRDARLAAQWRGTAGGLEHTLRGGWAGARQAFLFEGVQNIGGFAIDVAAPDFGAVDPAALALTPRYRRERAVERAWFLHDALRVAPGWVLGVGGRRIGSDVQADRTGGGLRAAARVRGNAWQLGLLRDATAGLAPYASYSEGLEPNRGRTRSGEFLPPLRAAQWELGLHARLAANESEARHTLHAALYRIDLDNLPAPDPLDRTALVSTGLRRVQGVEATWQWRAAGWRAQALANWQHTRNRRKTGADEGDAFVGVASRSAAARIDAPLPGVPERATAWVQWQALGPRWADAGNTVRVAGHGLWDVGLEWQHAALTLTASLRNVADRDHVATVTAPDNVYQGPRRRLWFGLTLNL